jgi:hypothetical protein
MLRDSGHIGLTERPSPQIRPEAPQTELYPVNSIPWDFIKSLPEFDVHEHVKRQSVGDFHQFRLPGAPNFQRYLQQMCGNGLQVVKPIRPGIPYSEHRVDGEDVYHVPWKVWKVFQYLRHIGDYFVGPRENTPDGEIKYKRRYEGRIPGRINQQIVERNKNKSWIDSDGELQPPRSFIPEDTVTLHFGYDVLRYPQSCLTQKIFKRFDGHKDIPFP